MIGVLQDLFFVPLDMKFTVLDVEEESLRFCNIIVAGLFKGSFLNMCGMLQDLNLSL